MTAYLFNGLGLGRRDNLSHRNLGYNGRDGRLGLGVRLALLSLGLGDRMGGDVCRGLLVGGRVPSLDLLDGGIRLHGQVSKTCWNKQSQ